MSSSNLVSITALLATILLFLLLGVEAVIALTGNSPVLVEQFEKDPQSSLIGVLIVVVAVIAFCIGEIIKSLFMERESNPRG